jgi:nuclear transport factor 2 (NTF2) superfamily protein
MSTEQEVIKHKVGLLRLAEDFGNDSRACKVMGYSRDTFYRYRQAIEEGGFESLVEVSRRKPWSAECELGFGPDTAGGRALAGLRFDPVLI